MSQDTVWVIFTWCDGGDWKWGEKIYIPLHYKFEIGKREGILRLCLPYPHMTRGIVLPLKVPGRYSGIILLLPRLDILKISLWEIPSPCLIRNDVRYVHKDIVYGRVCVFSALFMLTWDWVSSRSFSLRILWVISILLHSSSIYFVSL